MVSFLSSRYGVMPRPAFILSFIYDGNVKFWSIFQLLPYKLLTKKSFEYIMFIEDITNHGRITPILQPVLKIFFVFYAEYIHCITDD